MTHTGKSTFDTARITIKSKDGNKKEIPNTAQKMKFSIKDLFSKCGQTQSFLRIWSHLLKKSFMKDFSFCAVETSIIGYIRGTDARSVNG